MDCGKISKEGRKCQRTKTRPKKFVRQHSDTKLIIIDTLQKVREVGGDKYSYANDYEVVGKLKRLADDCGICLLLVHHTRKQQLAAVMERHGIEWEEKGTHQGWEKPTAESNFSVTPDGTMNVGGKEYKTFYFNVQDNTKTGYVGVKQGENITIYELDFTNVTTKPLVTDAKAMVVYDAATYNRLPASYIYNLFKDVPTDIAEYGTAIKWAVEKGITLGTDTVAYSTFSPYNPCIRAQMVVFLYRAAGSPTVTGTNAFTDVPNDAEIQKAVQWAVSKGITKGTSDTTFDPDAPCTRGQMVTFLHRNHSEPAASGSNNFADVPADAFYKDAVQWAVNEGITKGTGDTTFAPNDACTRVQMVTFLYRDMGK